MSQKENEPNCNICNGTGIVFIPCCSGNMCGCMGMAVAAKNCECGGVVNESRMSQQELLIFRNVEFLG